MIVISDTTAISTLLQVDQLALLPEIFAEVYIPEHVWAELLALKGYGIDLSPLENQVWLKIKNPSKSPLLLLLNTHLDEGEAHAIALAVELAADLLIIDEKEGRRVAQSMKLPYTGLGGVFIRAKQAGLISSVKEMLEVVRDKTSFYLGEKAYAIILEAAGELE